MIRKFTPWFINLILIQLFGFPSAVFAQEDEEIIYEIIRSRDLQAPKCGHGEVRLYSGDPDRDPNAGATCVSLQGMVDRLVSENSSSAIAGFIGSGAGAGSGDGTESEGNRECEDEGSTVGNPISVATQNKYQQEVDFMGFGDLPLHITRSYNSQGNVSGLFGRKWSDNLTPALRMNQPSTDIENGIVTTRVKIKRADGQVIGLLHDESTGQWTRKSGKVEQFFVDTTGAYLFIADGLEERYLPDGRLFSSRKQGETLYYFYGDDNDPQSKLVRIKHSSGQSIRFEYDTQGRIKTLYDPANNPFSYQYNAAGYLESVTYPSLTGVAKKQYTYGSKGELLRISDETNRPYASWTYGQLGQKANSSYHGDHQEEFKVVSAQYNANSRKVVTENALGKQTTHHFKWVGGQWKISQVQGHAKGTCLAANRSTTYDSRGFKDLVTDWNGSITDYDYNEHGLVTQIIQAKGKAEQQTTTYEWDHLLNKPTKISTELKESAMTYDSWGRLLSRTEKNLSGFGNIGEERTTTHTYTDYATGVKKTHVIDGPRTDVDDITTIEFTPQGFVSKIINALGHVTTFSQHTIFGKPKRVVYPDGKVTEMTYHPRGWLLTRTEDKNGDARTTTHVYDNSGMMTETTSPGGVKRFYVYDTARRLFRVTDGNVGNLGIINHKYDAASNITLTKIMRQQQVPVPCGSGGGWGDLSADKERLGAIKPAFGYCSELQMVLHKHTGSIYDALNRRTTSIDGDDTVAEYGYNASNKVISVKDGKDKTTYHYYDGLGRFKQKKDRNGSWSYFWYNTHNQVIRVKDPKGLNTYYEYDGFNQLTKQTSPDTGVTTFGYDKAGNLIQKLDARGKTLTRTYDALNRLKSESVGNISYSFIYDTTRNGYLYKSNDSSGSQTFTYNAHGEVTKRIDTLSGLTLITYWTYNKDGQRKSIRHPNGMTVTYSYDNLGQVKDIKSNNQVLLKNPIYKPFGPIESFQYGSNLRRIYSRDNRYRLTRLYAAGQMDLRYAFDENSNITQIQNEQASSSNKFRTYSYDNMDRIKTQNEFGSNSSMTYDANGNRKSLNSTVYTTYSSSNRLSSITGKAFAYDDNGNIKQKGNQYFTYNDANRMTGYQSDSTSSTYTYNALGQRILKNVNGTKTWFVYDVDGKLLYERSGSTHKSYLYRGNEIIGYTKNNTLYYVHADNTGRPEVITNTSNTRVWKSDNRAFDRSIKQDSLGGFNIGFPGQYWDVEKHSWYNYFRDYDSELGRYLQSDPVGLSGGINTYVYVDSNPLIFIDKYGLSKCNSEDDAKKKEECFNKCIQRNYGKLYNWAQYASPLSLVGAAGLGAGEIGSAYTRRLRAEGTRNLYGRSAMNSNRAYNSGVRQLRTVSQFGRINIASLMFGVGATTFLVTANAVCASECEG